MNYLEISNFKKFDLITSIIHEMLNLQNNIVYDETRLIKEKFWSENSDNSKLYQHLLNDNVRQFKMRLKELNHLYSQLFNIEYNELNYLEAIKFVINYVEEYFFNKEYPHEFVLRVIQLRKFIIENGYALGSI